MRLLFERGTRGDTLLVPPRARRRRAVKSWGPEDTRPLAQAWEEEEERLVAASEEAVFRRALTFLEHYVGSEASRGSRPVPPRP